MNRKMEGTLRIVAALLLLSSAMLDPRISAGLAVGVLAGYGTYKLIRSH